MLPGNYRDLASLQVSAARYMEMQGCGAVFFRFLSLGLNFL